jgi:ferritin-like protein
MGEPLLSIWNLIDQFDRDDAVKETAVEAVSGDTRASFLKKAGVGVGAVAAGGAFAGALPAIARGAAIPASDIAILNFALTLEFLEAAFYRQAVRKGHLHGDTKVFAGIVAKHEAVHVKTLKSVLGSKAVKSPKFDFKGTNLHQGSFQKTAFALENTGVHAYLGQAGNLKTGALLAAAASIVTVEARHAALIAQIMGKEHMATPDGAFDKPWTKKHVLRAVTATGFIVG